MIKLIPILAIIAYCQVSFAQEDSIRSEQLNNQAALILVLGDPHKAIILLDSALSLNPWNAKAYGNRSSAYDALNLTTEALDDANKSISLDSLNADLFYNRGLIFKNAMKTKEAVQDFKRAIELDERHILATLKMAYYYHQVVGENGKAKNVIENYLFHGTSGKKEEAELLGLYGFLFLEEGNYHKAQIEFNLAIAIDTSNAEAFYNRGAANYHLQNLDAALSDYTKAIQLEENHKKAFYNRALVHAALRNFDLAIKDYTKDLQINGPKANAFNNRGRCMMIQNKYESALNDFNMALELEPNRPVTIHNIGVLYLRQNLLEKACEYLTKAKQLGYTDQRLVNTYCE